MQVFSLYKLIFTRIPLTYSFCELVFTLSLTQPVIYGSFWCVLRCFFVVEGILQVVTAVSPERRISRRSVTKSSVD